MTTALDGKVAIVSGGARGIGGATVRRLAAGGARVVIGDVRDEQANALAADLGDQVAAVHLDVTSEDGWAASVQAAEELFGPVTVLVNNAGILRFGAITDISREDYLRTIDVNQVGVFLGMRAVVPGMQQAGGGSIVNLSSVEGLGGMPYLLPYTASKFAVRGMTKSAALELGPHGIRVNSVHPGAIATDMVREAAGGGDVDLSPIGKQVALGRTGAPEEVAEVIAFLASDASSYCTGSEFAVDGGATASSGFRHN